MRLFVAIFPPENVVKNLSEITTQGPTLHGIRWIPSSNIHITLKFIGPVVDQNVPIIQSVLAGISKQKSGFDLWLQAGGVFPNSQDPRVFWTAVKGNNERLSSLASLVESSLEGAGFPPENRKFKPHLTLGRPDQKATSSVAPDSRARTAVVKETKTGTSESVAAQFRTRLEGYKSDVFHVHQFNLVESRLSAKGPSYHILSSYTLL